MFGVQMLRCLYPMECVVKYLEHEKEAGSLELGLVSVLFWEPCIWFSSLVVSVIAVTLSCFYLAVWQQQCKKKKKGIYYIVILHVIIHCKTFSSVAYIDISKTTEGKKDAQ